MPESLSAGGPSAMDESWNSSGEVGVSTAGSKSSGFLRSRRRCLVCCSGRAVGSAAWLTKGLAICMVIMLTGAVGSFTLRQLMSPQAESLLQQRANLQQELAALRLQLENMTRVADSRLETIHLLEQELDKMAVDAAAEAAAATAQEGSGPLLRTGGHPAPVRLNFMLPTIGYASLLGLFLLIIICYRVRNIIREEHLTSKKSTQRQGGDDNDIRRELASTIMEHRLLSSTSPSSQVPAQLESISSISNSTEHLGTVQPRDAHDLEQVIDTPQCYKRAPGAAPAARLLHV